MTDRSVATETRALLEPNVQPVVHHAAWRWWERGLFRLAFLFWGDYCYQQGVSWQVMWIAPWADKWVLRWPFAVLDWPTDTLEWWFSTHLFHLSKEALSREPTGSGDTALSWITALALLVFAVVGSLLWTAVAEWGIAKRGWRREYRTLYAWLRLLVRFTLASVLLSYGFMKVFDLQFSPPMASRLNETYGASSPMGLLWTFMGASVPYTIFAGLAEMVAGLLLCFRRTSTMGALGAAAVMVNVVMLNFCYDVPVKLYSMELLLMALFLLLPDVTPLWRMLVLRRPAELTGVWVPRIERKPLRVATYCLQALVVGHLMYTTGYGSWTTLRAERSSLRGNWVVDATQGPVTDLKWTVMNFDGSTYMQTRTGADEGWTPFAWSSKEHVLRILGPEEKSGEDGKPIAEFHWPAESAGSVTLTGEWMGSASSVTMHQVATPTYPLLTRGFHWVQEQPYNR